MIFFMVDQLMEVLKLHVISILQMPQIISLHKLVAHTAAGEIQEACQVAFQVVAP